MDRYPETLKKFIEHLSDLQQCAGMQAMHLSATAKSNVQQHVSRSSLLSQKC